MDQSDSFFCEWEFAIDFSMVALLCYEVASQIGILWNNE